MVVFQVDVYKRQVIRAQPLKVTVRSTVGAGDAVMAALAYAFDTGLPWLDTIKMCIRDRLELI